jgi:hypothetical protein
MNSALELKFRNFIASCTLLLILLFIANTFKLYGWAYWLLLAIPLVFMMKFGIDLSLEAEGLEKQRNAKEARK